MHTDAHLFSVPNDCLWYDKLWGPSQRVVTLFSLNILLLGIETVPVHYVHFVKYDDAVSFYDAVSDTIRRRGGDRGIFTEEGVDTVAYFRGNHGFRV